MSGSSLLPSKPIIEDTLYRFEWPTWLLAVIVYGGWLTLTYCANALPWWLVLPAGGWIIAWHGSLQHEAIHSHPTRKLWVNTALAFPPLGLWLPFLRYRELHLAHHRDELLTDPLEDPESYYMTEEAWARRGPVSRVVRRFLNTAIGRLAFGPAVAVTRFYLREGAAFEAGHHRRVWAFHALGVIAVLLWVELVCGIPFWRYLALFVYPGLALTALRSMAEHRAAPEPDHRTAIVEATPLFGLLFLNNNLHVVHHRYPGMPWYALPLHYRANRESFVRQNNGLVYQGYRDVIRRYLLREHHQPVMPQGCLPAPPQTALLEGAR